MKAPMTKVLKATEVIFEAAAMCLTFESTFYAKGQLISECPFDFPKNHRKI